LPPRPFFVVGGHCGPPRARLRRALIGYSYPDFGIRGCGNYSITPLRKIGKYSEYIQEYNRGTILEKDIFRILKLSPLFSSSKLAIEYIRIDSSG